MLTFKPKYLLLTIGLFAVEVLIALYGSGWIRSHLGDVLVVILVYAGIRTMLNIRVLPTVLGTVLFAFLVELSQYFHLVELLGWQDYRWVVVVMGNTFQWLDLVSYALGGVLVLLVEKK